ncbi:hypothetical protein T12_15670 [Trichinella patagoniensis]|uniref:Uncharacterized protein n=1 Tax=Trichinella patagoniensis TaxID=990121 RepID=A0A0V0YXK3_9BILA|nr:hypothetical protein T12_15670 [Trichinella patagoniensis]
MSLATVYLLSLAYSCVSEPDGICDVIVRLLFIQTLRYKQP